MVETQIVGIVIFFIVKSINTIDKIFSFSLFVVVDLLLFFWIIKIAFLVIIIIIEFVCINWCLTETIVIFESGASSSPIASLRSMGPVPVRLAF